MSKRMTRADALREAQRRWGRRSPTSPSDPIARVSKDLFGYCMVGRQERGERIIEALGCGETWEDACADADHRALRAPERER